MRTVGVLVVSVVARAAACGGDDDGGPPVVCTYEGRTYAVGDTWTAGDQCNTSHCREDGRWACTLKYCACFDDDLVPHELGSSWPAGDGCNTCTCLPGMPNFVASCTMDDCEADGGVDGGVDGGGEDDGGRGPDAGAAAPPRSRPRDRRPAAACNVRAVAGVQPSTWFDHGRSG